MTTSTTLAQAARALHAVLQSGHRGLDANPQETVIAAHARDQVLAGLVALHHHLHPVGPRSLPLSAADMLRHPARGLAQALRRREPTGLHGPTPSELALAPPTHTAARGWVEAAHQIEAAVVDAHRSGPDSMPLAVTHPPDGPALPTLRGSWALAADLAAISSTIAVLDPHLAAAIERVSQQATLPDNGPDKAELTRAVDRLRRPALDDLRLTASLTLRLAESGKLPADYHLPPVATRPTRVTSSWTIPLALDRATELLAAAKPLAGAQHRAVALAVAMTAERLAQVLDEPLAPALRDLASAQLAHGATWTTSPLAAADLGDWGPVTQLRQIVQQLDRDLAGWARTPPDPVIVQQLRRAANRLPAVTRAADFNLRAGLAAGAYLAPEAPTDAPSIWIPATRDLVGRVKLERTASETVKAADAVSIAAGRPSQLAPDAAPAVAQTARGILRVDAYPHVPRPAHPTTHPSPRPDRRKRPSR